MNRSRVTAAVVAALLGAAVLSGTGFAQGPPTGGETGANNLTFPVILSDNATPSSFPVDGVWRFAPITDPATECIGEAGVTVGTPVPPEYLCYYGDQVTVVSETGEIVFTPPTKVWWLQKRTQNFWKALSVGHDAVTPLVVSAVDVGDLLESSPAIKPRMIRVEFNLLQHVDPADLELGQYVVPEWTSGFPDPCTMPAASGENLACFAAFAMSGAVPGTEQSGNEMQGTDFGPGPDPGLLTGTLTLLDPATVRLTDPDVGGIEALVYSNCARLVIQQIAGAPTWDEATGQWAGAGVVAPLVNVATYSATSPWAVEITSGGSIVYGYNWNAKTVSAGTYRLTFVLDGNDAEGPVCGTTLATMFAPLGGTTLVNQGENNPSSIVYAGDADLGDEGGLAYIDLTLTTTTGGGGGGRIGVVRQGAWSIDTDGSGTWDPLSDGVSLFGLATDNPVTGDWDADGITEFGVFRKGKWSIDTNGNGVWDAGIDTVYPAFGLSGDKPVTGDWNGDGSTQIGVFRNGKWYLDANGNGAWDPGVDTVYAAFGLANDVPVTGDWNGDGVTQIGVFRNGKWYLDANGNGAWDPGIDTVYAAFGLSGDLPVTGDWDDDGTTQIGVFRNGKWYLDANANGAWDAGVDTVYLQFGLEGDIPVTGNW